MNENLTEQEIIRREKAEELRAMGIDPFGNAFYPTFHSKDIVESLGINPKKNWLRSMRKL